MAELTREQEIAVYEQAQALLARRRGYATHELYKSRFKVFDSFFSLPSLYSNSWTISVCARGAICVALREAGLTDWRPNDPTEMTLSAKAARLLELEPILDSREPLVEALVRFNNSTDQQTVVAGFGTVIKKLKAELATNTQRE